MVNHSLYVKALEHEVFEVWVLGGRRHLPIFFPSETSWAQPGAAAVVTVQGVIPNVPGQSCKIYLKENRKKKIYDTCALLYVNGIRGGGFYLGSVNGPIQNYADKVYVSATADAPLSFPPTVTPDFSSARRNSLALIATRSPLGPVVPTPTAPLNEIVDRNVMGPVRNNGEMVLGPPTEFAYLKWRTDIDNGDVTPPDVRFNFMYENPTDIQQRLQKAVGDEEYRRVYERVLGPFL